MMLTNQKINYKFSFKYDYYLVFMSVSGQATSLFIYFTSVLASVTVAGWDRSIINKQSYG